MNNLTPPLPVCQALTIEHTRAPYTTAALRDAFMAECARLINTNREPLSAAHLQYAFGLVCRVVTHGEEVQTKNKKGLRAWKIHTPHQYMADAGYIKSGETSMNFLGRIKRSLGIIADISGYTPLIESRVCRVMLTPELVRIAEEMSKLNPHRNDLVYFCDGTPFHHSDRRELNRLRAVSAKRTWDNPVAAYYDDADDALFSRYEKRTDELLENLNRKIESGAVSRKDASRAKEYADTLHNLLGYGVKPFYVQKEGHGRAFAQGVSLQNIPSALRRKILFDAHEYDIVSCHLAIAISLFPEMGWLADKLNNGVDIIAELIAAVGRENNKSNRKIAKEFLYGALNGRHYIAGKIMLSKLWNDKDATAFFELPEIEAIHSATRAALAHAIEKGYVLTHRGGRIPVKDAASARRGMALVYQTIEFDLMAAIYEWAGENRDKITIISHEHDGLSFRTENGTDVASIEDAFSRVINEAAQTIVREGHLSMGALHIRLACKRTPVIEQAKTIIKRTALDLRAWVRSALDRKSAIPHVQSAESISVNPSAPAHAPRRGTLALRLRAACMTADTMYTSIRDTIQRILQMRKLLL